VSSPEVQLSGRYARNTIEQLGKKPKPEFEKMVISTVDFQGSTRGDWAKGKIRCVDEEGKPTYHKDGFNRYNMM